MRLTFDSNVLIYAADHRAGARHREATDLLRRATTADCILTLQSLGEFYNVAVRKAGLAHGDAAMVTRNWQRVFPIHAADEQTFEWAVNAAGRYRIQFWDAMICAAARQARCRFLLSEDLQDGQMLDGLTILNPFNPAHAATLSALLPP